MNTRYKATLAALAFSALVAQPITANATQLKAHGSSILHGLWAVGIVVCTGVTFVHQDRRAAATSTTVSDRARLRALAGCAFPPLGFALLHHNR